MIVWLASYPRSGNTLLRTVVHQTMGCETYSDEVDPEVRRNVGLTGAVESEFGRREVVGPWEDFYREATESSDTFFVKTHHPPRDAQPTLYVVRDGRRALVSYERFHRRFQPERARTLLDLVLGRDHYGGWSEHHRRWTARPQGRLFMVRFEELVDASDSLVEGIARFIGHAREPAPWRNPLARMQQDNPGFFGEGARAWAGDPAWSPFIDAAFFHLNGTLMAELGYVTAAEAEQRAAAIGGEARAALTLAASAIAESRALETVCRERQAVIEELDRACSERQAVIGDLQRVCAEREAVIEELRRACEERLALIERLSGQLEGAAEGARQ